MAERCARRGPCLAALEPHMPRSRMLAPLLLLAAIHRMVLEGRLPGAARFYPSTGGQADEDALWPYFLEAVPRALLPACVQTNEVGRSHALLPAFLEVARQAGLPLRLLEIGASAGLNLRWDHFPFPRRARRDPGRRAPRLRFATPSIPRSTIAVRRCSASSGPIRPAVCNCSPR